MYKICSQDQNDQPKNGASLHSSVSCYVRHAYLHRSLDLVMFLHIYGILLFLHYMFGTDN